MNNLKYFDENTLIKKAISILMKELGAPETIRFLNIPREKKMDSVKYHREWQKKLNKDKFLNKVFKEK
jgi:hypothetical protein